jgi:hypothetical protein
MVTPNSHRDRRPRGRGAPTSHPAAQEAGEPLGRGGQGDKNGRGACNDPDWEAGGSRVSSLVFAGTDTVLSS